MTPTGRHDDPFRDSVKVTDSVTIRLIPGPPITEVVTKVGPDGETTTEYLRGAERDRTLVRIDDWLRKRAAVESQGDDCLDLLSSICSPQQIITPELGRAVEEALSSRRRRPPRGRIKPRVTRAESRSECFRRLAMALGIVGSELSAESLQRVLRRARAQRSAHRRK
jgi:hypothetical protein